MSRDFEDTVKMQAPRVNLMDRAQVEITCEMLHCSEQQLRAAVYAVGGHDNELQAYFRGMAEGQSHGTHPKHR